MSEQTISELDQQLEQNADDAFNVNNEMTCEDTANNEICENCTDGEQTAEGEVVTEDQNQEQPIQYENCENCTNGEPTAQSEVVTEDQNQEQPTQCENCENCTNDQQTAQGEVVEQTTNSEAVIEQSANDEQSSTQTSEQPEVEKVEKKQFKLTAPCNLEQILSVIATKRARKLLYSPKEVIYETSCKIDTLNKKNEEGIKVKDILNAEINEGLKLGYLEKYDGLKTSEIKEEYENDTVWEIAEQEFKKCGFVLDGENVKVYVYDWTANVCHHVGYLPTDVALEVNKYLVERDNYSFDICAIITGGKSKTITKDAQTGKFTITKNKDGDYSIDLDITIIKRKD